MAGENGGCRSGGVGFGIDPDSHDLAIHLRPSGCSGEPFESRALRFEDDPVENPITSVGRIAH